VIVLNSEHILEYEHHFVVIDAWDIIYGINKMTLMKPVITYSCQGQQVVQFRGLNRKSQRAAPKAVYLQAQSKAGRSNLSTTGIP
jgi:hypothetical protein